MRIALLNLVSRLRRDEEGVTLVEYGVAVAFAIAAGGLMASILVPGFSDALTAAVAAMG